MRRPRGDREARGLYPTLKLEFEPIPVPMDAEDVENLKGALVVVVGAQWLKLVTYPSSLRTPWRCAGVGAARAKL